MRVRAPRRTRTSHSAGVGPPSRCESKVFPQAVRHRAGASISSSVITRQCSRYHGSRQHCAPTYARVGHALFSAVFVLHTCFAPTPHKRCRSPDTPSPAVSLRAGSMRHPEVTLVSRHHAADRADQAALAGDRLRRRLSHVLGRGAAHTWTFTTSGPPTAPSPPRCSPPSAATTAGSPPSPSSAPASRPSLPQRRAVHDQNGAPAKRLALLAREQRVRHSSVIIGPRTIVRLHRRRLLDHHRQPRPTQPRGVTNGR